MMSSIRIAAKSIDDLNLIYKKIKKDFQANDSIKLNQETLEYELFLKRFELDGSLKAICNKVIDTDDLMDDGSVFDGFSQSKLVSMMAADKVAMPWRPLKAVWADLSEVKRNACFQYFCDELELTTESPTV
ncbi:hypothetical protein [Marinoscillum sp.]|uniref:hypothetical protein n=1 Tax=Marinoscillum sp. TaxID=2024838 RepID=UPI003BAC4EE3